MGIVAGTSFLGYKFEHVNRRLLNGSWRVRGTIYWTLDPRGLLEKGWKAVLEDWDRGYKIGFLLEEDQTIKKLVYGGVSLSAIRPQADEVADLNATYGTLPNFQWQVWGGRGHRPAHDIIPPNIITFPIELMLSGGQAPQMIPVASRLRKGLFRQSLGGLWVIKPERRAAARRVKAVRRRR